MEGSGLGGDDDSYFQGPLATETRYRKTPAIHAPKSAAADCSSRLPSEELGENSTNTKSYATYSRVLQHVKWLCVLILAFLAATECTPLVSISARVLQTTSDEAWKLSDPTYIVSSTDRDLLIASWMLQHTRTVVCIGAFESCRLVAKTYSLDPHAPPVTLEIDSSNSFKL